MGYDDLGLTQSDIDRTMRDVVNYPTNNGYTGIEALAKMLGYEVVILGDCKGNKINIEYTFSKKDGKSVTLSKKDIQQLEKDVSDYLNYKLFQFEKGQ